MRNRFWYRCFPLIFAIFLRRPFLQSTSQRVILNSDFCRSFVCEYQSKGFRMWDRFLFLFVLVLYDQRKYNTWAPITVRSIKDCISVNRFNTWNNDLRYNNACLILLICFYYILPNLHEFVVCQKVLLPLML